MSDVVIVAAKRTPFGRFLGGLSDLSAVDLATVAGEATLHRECRFGDIGREQVRLKTVEAALELLSQLV